MTQALYAHMNNKTIKKTNKTKKYQNLFVHIAINNFSLTGYVSAIFYLNTTTSARGCEGNLFQAFWGQSTQRKKTEKTFPW
jgi:hypothetical protein